MDGLGGPPLSSNVRRAMSIEKIASIAKEMRAAIERTDRGFLPITFKDFPRGSCGDAALILGRHLRESGYEGFQYVLASRGDRWDNSWYSHAWIERQGLIVDITADQFPDFPHNVFVGTESQFHATFEVEERSEADYAIYDVDTASTLARAYREILKQYGRA